MIEDKNKSACLYCGEPFDRKPIPEDPITFYSWLACRKC
jgi:hypothetical protein